MPTMPAQRPGQSRQDYGTSWELIRAVEERWGKVSWDLAASATNAKAPKFFTVEDDSLSRSWHRECEGLLWLNPPFANIGDWARKCQYEMEQGARILMLTPASVGSNWYAEHCFYNADSVFLRPRLTFEGCDQPYPKDCMLTYWFAHTCTVYPWNWKEGTVG